MQAEVIQEIIDEEIKQAEKKYGKEVKNLLLKILLLEKQLNPEVKESRLIPLSEWNKYYPYPTKGTLYQYNFDKENNGFDCCTEKGGKHGNRILINDVKFWEWHNNRFKNDTCP